ncbi:putative E3 ubiquitin-protein ligase [Hordeum vulgare]|nr:putative E3 ubiquitin-protein ligase [Hordeum vulgare]
MCYRRSGVHEEANTSKTVLDAAPLAVCLDDDAVLPPGTLLLNVNGEGLSGRAKAWCCWGLAVAMTMVVFVVWPDTFIVPPIDPVFTRYDDASFIDGDGEVFDCAICMETVPGTLKFSVGSCGHAFCSGCVGQECSAPLLADDGKAGAAAIAEAECPHCHRMFCARCATPWHTGVGCREFQELGQDERGREDLLLRSLAGRLRWQRCPKCRMYVEKSEGCNNIQCRCGSRFCYRCASKVSWLTHYCKKCER